MAKNNTQLPYNCKYNQIVGCADIKGCKRCGWSPEVEARRKRKLHADLNAKPPTKTRPIKPTRAVTWK